METATGNNGVRPHSGKKKGLAERINSIDRPVALTIVVPVSIAIAYLGLNASDVSASEARPVVLKPDRQIQSNAAGALLQRNGLSSNSGNAPLANDCSQSRATLARSIFSKDILRTASERGEISQRFRFINPAGSFEALHRHEPKDINGHVIGDSFQFAQQQS